MLLITRASHFLHKFSKLSESNVKFKLCILVQEMEGSDTRQLAGIFTTGVIPGVARADLFTRLVRSETELSPARKSAHDSRGHVRSRVRSAKHVQFSQPKWRHPIDVFHLVQIRPMTDWVVGGEYEGSFNRDSLPFLLIYLFIYLQCILFNVFS